MGDVDWLKVNAKAIQELQVIGLKERTIWKTKYGNIRIPITTRHNGMGVQIVGDQIITGDWLTFADFLMDYLKSKLGEQWGNNEIRKPLAKRNEVIKAYQAYCLWQQKAGMRDGLINNSYPSGEAQRFLSIAWDLFVLEDNGAIPKRIIERLKDRNNYQGARYELHVFAALVRAGFRLEYSDETNGKTKHTECTATLITSGESISVEAKSRHRHGSLGFHDKKQHDKVGLGIERLIKEARAKPANHPYILFLDVNLGVFPIQEFYLRHRDEICRILDSSELGNRDKQHPKIAGYFLTNDPLHHLSDSPVTSGSSFQLYVGPSEYRGPPSISLIQTIEIGLRKHPIIPHFLLYL